MHRRVDLSSPFHRLRVLVVMLATMILTIGFAASVALAVPAAPMVRTLSNPDGTTIQARQWGDEWYHGWETLEGYTIVKDRAGFWCYAQPDAEKGLVPSSVRADIVSLRSVPRHVRPPKEFLDRIDEMRRSAVQEVQIGKGPAVGRFPVLLITFSDRTPTYSQTNFNNLMFGDTPDPAVVSGPGTMKSFYEEVSYGQYSVQGVVRGWFTAKNPHAYYGKNVEDYAGNDAHAVELVVEAVLAADNSGFDWTPYDTNHDGYVDVVAIVHQGNGEEEGADPNDIWSHSWSLRAAKQWLDEGPGEITTHDGMKVDNYIIMPELLGVEALGDWYAGMATVGVFCHEYGHAIGLPDLYDTDYSSQGIGNWGLMGGGSWNFQERPGDSPAYMTAWSRIRKGWLDPELISTSTSLAIPDVETSGIVCQLLDGPEHFLLENRQPVGFDAALPGHGLLIWHIDDNKTSNRDDAHRMVDLEEADGLDDLDHIDRKNRGDAGDPYPGSSQKSEFTADSYPNSLRYDGTKSGVFVTGIAEADGVVTATVGNASPSIAVASATPGWGEPPLTVKYSAQVSDPDGDLKSTWWEMPDGTSVDGTEATATFTNAGVYTAIFHAVDGAGNSVSQAVSVVAAQEGSVVLVDDDEGSTDTQGNGYETYFTRALETAGIPYVTTTAPVHVSTSIPYIIVWNCNDGYPTLTVEDQKFLAAYLDGGGRLFLSGQDVLFEIADQTTFAEKYLHVAGRNDDVGTDHVYGVEGDPISGGLSIELAYPFADWSDNIYLAADAVGLFTNDSGKFAALRYEGKYKVIFLAFPFEAIPGPGAPVVFGARQPADDAPAEILERALGWFNNRPPHISLNSPGDGDVLTGTHTITWVAGDDDNSDDDLTVALYWSGNGGATWQQIAAGLPASGTYEWDTSRVGRGGQYVVRALVRDPWDSRATDEANVRIGVLTGTLGIGPNPASQTVNIYHAPVAGTIFVYDLSGRLVADHAAAAGESVWVWNLTTNDGRPLANGLYLIVFVAEDGTRSQVERLIIQRR